MTMCVAGFMPETIGGAAGKALYIDSEGSFRPERIEAIAERFGLDAAFILEHTMCARVHTADQMEERLLAAGAVSAARDSTRALVCCSRTAGRLARADRSLDWRRCSPRSRSACS